MKTSATSRHLQRLASDRFVSGGIKASSAYHAVAERADAVAARLSAPAARAAAKRLAEQWRALERAALAMENSDFQPTRLA
jgi:hypothetical protein